MIQLFSQFQAFNFYYIIFAFIVCNFIFQQPRVFQPFAIKCLPSLIKSFCTGFFYFLLHFFSFYICKCRRHCIYFNMLHLKKAQKVIFLFAIQHIFMLLIINLKYALQLLFKLCLIRRYSLIVSTDFIVFAIFFFSSGCDFFNQGPPTKSCTNVTNKNHGG